MAAYEWIVVAYFSGLTLAAWLVPVSLTRRLDGQCRWGGGRCGHGGRCHDGAGCTARVGSSRFLDCRLLDAGAAGAVSAGATF